MEEDNRHIKDTLFPLNKIFSLMYKKSPIIDICKALLPMFSLHLNSMREVGGKKEPFSLVIDVALMSLLLTLDLSPCSSVSMVHFDHVNEG